MAKKRILICGATGFIGRNVAERLAENDDYEVVGTYFKSAPFSHPKIKLVQADLTSKEDVDRVIPGADMIIQAAAVTTGAKDVVMRPYLHVTDNVIMNARILQAVFDHSVPRFLFTSCTVMYPPNLGRPIKETDVDYDSIYDKYLGAAWMKIYVEKLCLFYSRLMKTKFTIMRHSNMYGPYDKYDLDRSHVTSATITKVVTNTDGVLPVWGDGTEERDLLYISDLVDFIERAVATPERSAFEIYNVGLGKGISVRELVEKVVKVSGKKLAIQYDATKPHIKMNVTLDTSKAKAMFGWEPRTSLDEGLRLTMDWYKKDLL
jgi:nucleoside-diphosphate-sugar epimerase